VNVTHLTTVVFLNIDLERDNPKGTPFSYL